MAKLQCNDCNTIYQPFGICPNCFSSNVSNIDENQLLLFDSTGEPNENIKNIIKM